MRRMRLATLIARGRSDVGENTAAFALWPLPTESTSSLSAISRHTRGNAGAYDAVRLKVLNWAPHLCDLPLVRFGRALVSYCAGRTERGPLCATERAEPTLFPEIESLKWRIH